MSLAKLAFKDRADYMESPSTWVVFALTRGMEISCSKGHNLFSLVFVSKQHCQFVCGYSTQVEFSLLSCRCK